MRELISLPRYPLTERYEPLTAPWLDSGYADQSFLYCERCSHGSLANVLPREELYGAGYRTRTAASAGSLRAIRNFADFVGGRIASMNLAFVDIGGNDATLVGLFDGRARVIVDPNASGNATCVNAFIEDADLSPWADMQKVILSSHTLEHIADPHVFMRKVREIMRHDDVLAIQLPSLELLVEDARIEQIHHQHLHYYSRRSLTTLLAQYGLEVFAHRYDHDHYGALMVMARVGDGAAQRLPDWKDLKALDILLADDRFGCWMSGAGAALSGRSFVILGAALMLPVLKYYLPDIARAEYIADNDKSKNGLRYTNLNVPIRNDYDLEGRDVLIGAINTKLACRALTQLAFEKGARNVIVPLQVL